MNHPAHAHPTAAEAPQPKQSPAEIARDYAMIALGTLVMAVGIYFFKFPNHFSTGGVTGISIVLGHYIASMTPGTLVVIINAALLLVGFAAFGRSFGIRTAFSSTLLSAVVWLLERLVPLSAPLTTQPLLELMFAVALPAVGSAMLFNMQASSGGTDIVAMILKKYSSLNIGNALFAVDFLITVAACFAFGIETGLISMMGLFIKSVMVDMVLENIKICKCFHIITADPQPIVNFIVKALGRGATVLNGEGAYTHENRVVILTAVSRAQAVQLRRFARESDPHCFVLITNTGEIIGKGFRGVM